jgi:hypothetical protein
MVTPDIQLLQAARALGAKLEDGDQEGKEGNIISKDQPLGLKRTAVQ